MYYSQYGQDKYLHENIFNDGVEGVFIDIGANDGITLSNTYFLEKGLGWKGVCVEPIPLSFGKLTENRKSLNLNWCISDRAKPEVEFLVVEGYAEMLSGIYSNYSSKHVHRIDEYIKQNGGHKYITKIPTKTFMDIVAISGFAKIDYCSIDVEGAEVDVLRGIDFNLVDISLMSIENNYGTKSVRNLLVKNGYRFVCRLGDDELYQKITEPITSNWVQKLLKYFN